MNGFQAAMMGVIILGPYILGAVLIIAILVLFVGAMIRLFR